MSHRQVLLTIAPHLRKSATMRVGSKVFCRYCQQPLRHATHTEKCPLLIIKRALESSEDKPAKTTRKPYYTHDRAMPSDTLYLLDLTEALVTYAQRRCDPVWCGKRGLEPTSIAGIAEESGLGKAAVVNLVMHRLLADTKTIDSIMRALGVTVQQLARFQAQETAGSLGLRTKRLTEAFAKLRSRLTRLSQNDDSVYFRKYNTQVGYALAHLDALGNLLGVTGDE